MRILVTGGTGHLGRVVVARLTGEGHELRVLARRPSADSGVEWITGDLATGEGVREAVAGVDAIVHAATHSPAAQRGRFRLGDFVRSPADVDVEGTRALLEAGEREGIGQLVHVSIAGLRSMRRLPYARRKLEAEALVRGSDVPWSIVRATGFYWLLERMFENMVSQPVLALPAHACMAPVDSDEFADEIVDCVVRRRLGEREDFAGPQTLTMTRAHGAVPHRRRTYAEDPSGAAAEEAPAGDHRGQHRGLGRRAARNDHLGAMAQRSRSSSIAGRRSARSVISPAASTVATTATPTPTR